jgi:hypothetical protein
VSRRIALLCREKTVAASQHLSQSSYSSSHVTTSHFQRYHGLEVIHPFCV